MNIHIFKNNILRSVREFVLLAVAVFFSVACAASSSVFPDVALETSEDSIALPNPISLVVDEANGQILVSNSNVDIFFIQGSLAVINVDGSNPNRPVFSAASVIAAPNFSGKMFDDGSGNVFIPFRESSSTDASRDIIQAYSLTDDTVTLVTEATVANDPFGISGNSTDQVYVVSDDVLSVFDTDLNLLAEIDLTVAELAEIADTDASDVDQVAYDATQNRLFISNRDGKILVVDLNTNEVVQVIDGPGGTRDLIIDNDILYALDGDTTSVWIFDLGALTTSAELTEVDDSIFLLGTVAVGTDPNGMVLDAGANRLYVANSFEDTISVIDLVTRTEIARISIDEEDILTDFNRDGEDPQALAIGTFDGNTFLFVASYGTNSIVAINIDTLSVVQVYPNTEFDLED